MWPNYINGPDAVDLTTLVHHKLDQDGVGSCGSEGITQGVMIAHALATGGIPEKLNPWFIYQGSCNGYSLSFTSGKLR